ncbi:MAG: hypothetical protein R2834_20080 [Rhodothermales bacterium]
MTNLRIALNRLTLGAFLAVLGVFGLQPLPAWAQDNPFGVGIILGAPTGISAKYWVRDTRAIDMAAAWSLENDGSIQLIADYVWHTTRFEGLETNRSYAYYGIGGRLSAGERAVIGVRGPFGATYLFDEPFDVFIEVVPVFDLAPYTRLTLQLGIGGRYYFTPRRRRHY